MRAARAAAGGNHAPAALAELLIKLQAVAQGEHHPFHHGAHQVRAAMLEGQPKEHAAGQRVHVRRAFAGQIRQIDQPSLPRGTASTCVSITR